VLTEAVSGNDLLNLQPVLAVALLGSVFMPWWRA